MLKINEKSRLLKARILRYLPLNIRDSIIEKKYKKTSKKNKLKKDSPPVEVSAGEPSQALVLNRSPKKRVSRSDLDETEKNELVNNRSQSGKTKTSIHSNTNKYSKNKTSSIPFEKEKVQNEHSAMQY